MRGTTKKNLEKIAIEIPSFAVTFDEQNKNLKTTATTDVHTLHVACSYKKLREVDLSPRVDFFTTPPTGLIALAVESKKESGQVNVSSIRAEQVSR